MSENQGKNSKGRDSRFELLRLLLMYMVIILHYNNDKMGGAFAYATGYSLYLLKGFEVISICAVNCFVLITGYFSCKATKVTLKKPVMLLLMVMGYQLAGLIGQFVTGAIPFSFYTLLWGLIPANWFVTMFIVLYLISPYLNIIVEKLERNEFKRFLLILGILFFIYPTLMEAFFSIKTGDSAFMGLGTVTASSSAGGYTIVNFVCMYMIGAYIRKFSVSCSTIKGIGIFAAASLLDFLFSMKSNNYTAYSNILVVIQAVSLFLIFASINTGSVKIINSLAKSSFSIYLIHTTAFMITVFWGKFSIPKHSAGGVGEVLCNLFLSVTAMYIACLIIDYIRRGIFCLIKDLIHKE